jgi:hypothetical protein
MITNCKTLELHCGTYIVMHRCNGKDFHKHSSFYVLCFTLEIILKLIFILNFSEMDS